jgi:hypothetical protein
MKNCTRTNHWQMGAVFSAQKCRKLITTLIVIIPIVGFALNCAMEGHDKDPLYYYLIPPLCTKSSVGASCAGIQWNPGPRQCLGSASKYSYCDNVNAYGGCTVADAIKQDLRGTCGMRGSSPVCDNLTAVGNPIPNSPRPVPCGEGYDAERCPE